ncbi:hypothetical protein [Kocuria sp. NPDC057446]|uniref:hypothetical protein n=1 Tax=Kocuria sp. NPDC057446 TaxID=3346137 RepID=UPI0036C1D82B
MTEDRARTARQRLMASIAWSSLPVSTVLTPLPIDGQDSGVAWPLWTVTLPALSGIAGSVAGFRAQEEFLGVAAAAFGLLAVPVAIPVVVLLHGP